MEFKFSGNRIYFDKELSDLDNLVIKFVELLNLHGINYVFVSGYVAILFGRSRNTEDIDLFIEKVSFEKFRGFWNDLQSKGFECLNTSSAEEAYNDYLNEKLAIRFALEGTFIPNFELKFAESKYNKYSLQNKLEVSLNGFCINISELELQIAFKLKLGSEKDFEDARHLYNIFKESLDKELLKRQIDELRVVNEAELVLWGKD